MFLPIIDGPIVDTNMSFTLLSSRANESDVMFTLSFNVSFGPPSMIRCVDGSNTLLFDPVASRYTVVPGLSREVIRSHYINSSYPDMTRVTVTLTSPRRPRTYTCNVTVEGRVNINNNSYTFANKGIGTATVSITGECVTAVLNPTAHALLILLLLHSCRHSNKCHCQQDWLQQC